MDGKGYFSFMKNICAETRKILSNFRNSRGRVTVLTGAGISAESGIPTFRGPEGYWTVGSQEYRPEEMATYSMFSKKPWEVWAWYLYRRTVCKNAAPNSGHLMIAEMEKLFGDRFRLITQNVDGLHLRAGNTPDRTYQIHGNLHWLRCAADCTDQLFSFPAGIGAKKKNEPVTNAERKLLTCPVCQGLARPHVLWFDEYYDETFFRAESALQWATTTDLLLVIGTAGATQLPIRIGGVVSQNPRAILIDINIQNNPFRKLAGVHSGGIIMEGGSGENLAQIMSVWKA